ncbi:MAG: hypothetical protein AAAFM81_13640 [Pseudomonadota bacterium]
MNAGPQLKAQFLEIGDERLLCTTFTPAEGEPVVGTLCVIQPFAEELNRARMPIKRMAIEATSFGWTTHVIDLSGTGDSSGDFSNASLGRWRQELQKTLNLLFRLAPANAARGLLAIRSSMLLLSGLQLNSALDRVIAWQPVSSGRKWLREFLRIASMRSLSSTEDKPTRKPKDILAESGAIEIAGYWLSREFADELSQTEATIEPELCPAIDIIELGATVSPALQKFDEALQSGGIASTLIVAPNEPFWRIQEPVDTNSLSTATIQRLRSMVDV